MAWCEGSYSPCVALETANLLFLSPQRFHPSLLVLAALLARVFAVDVTRCPACGGRLRLVAVLSNPTSIRSYLPGVGLASESPAIAAARPPPQRELELDV